MHGGVNLRAELACIPYLAVPGHIGEAESQGQVGALPAQVHVTIGLQGKWLAVIAGVTESELNSAVDGLSEAADCRALAFHGPAEGGRTFQVFLNLGQRECLGQVQAGDLARAGERGEVVAAVESGLQVEAAANRVTAQALDFDQPINGTQGDVKILGGILAEASFCNRQFQACIDLAQRIQWQGVIALRLRCRLGHSGSGVGSCQYQQCRIQQIEGQIGVDLGALQAGVFHAATTLGLAEHELQLQICGEPGQVYCAAGGQAQCFRCRTRNDQLQVLQRGFVG